MSSENVKAESENVGKYILSPENRNRTLFLKKNTDEKVEVSDTTGGISPIIKVTPAKSVNKTQTTPKKGEPPSKNVNKADVPKNGVKKENSLGKKTIVDVTNSGLLGLSGKLREKKQAVPTKLLKGTINTDLKSFDTHKSTNSPSVLTGSSLVGLKNLQSSAKITNMVKKINAARELNPNVGDIDPLKFKFVKTDKNNLSNRPHLFGHEPATYTTNPLIIEDLIDELEEKAKNYFIMFSKERKEREKLERQCYWMQEENKTLQNTLKNQVTTIQGLQNKIIDLRGNPNVITETIERIDMLYTQLDTLIQAFAGICSYITFNEPTDRREIIELVLEYLHPCRGLDLRLNSLYGSIYYFKLGIIKDLPPPIQPPEKIPGYDVWQPPPPKDVETKESENKKLQPHMQQGNSLSKVADHYMKHDAGEPNVKTSAPEKGNKDENAIPKILTPVASTKQSVVPTNSSQLSGDINIPLSGFEIKIKSVEEIDPIGDGKGKLSFVARIDNESFIQCKNNPKRKSMEFEYKINPTNNKGSIENEINLEIDALPPKSTGLIPRFTIDMWESSITSGPIGHASKTFIDPYTLLPEQSWDVLKEDGDKPLATLIITVIPKPGNSMLPAGRFIVAKELKNKQNQPGKKDSKLSRLSFRGDKESKGLDKINSMLRPALNIGKRSKSTGNLDKDEKLEKLKEGSDLTKAILRPLSLKESSSTPPAPVLTKAESQESSNVPKSPPISVKEPPKSSAPEPDVSSLKKSMDVNQPPKADLKSSLKAPPSPEKVEEVQPKNSEPTVKESVSKSEQAAAPKSDLNKSNSLNKSGELGKSQANLKSVALKKSVSGEISANKSVSASKADVKSSKSEVPNSDEVKVQSPEEVKVLSPIKIVPKIAPKPSITKEQPLTNNAPKAVQANNLTPGKPGQIAPPPIIKKIDVKPAAIKPKIVPTTPTINIKKPGSPIQIKPKGIELGKPAVTITPKFTVTPPKSGSVKLGNTANQPKEDIKIVVTKGAVNISPKIVPKVKITPKAKI
ncbi:uncharacterized protein cubi_02534 [Cryptosporidium ubiquitum]|uniref:Uncharacterized protein n=1 Tax=Cryptosporidium ubiquitum TaxID=857276 RepID=A0A1J4MGE2_9CRYT|nr:uncharacterized protein cubi_02534 [Cryptosporidium ubiquitum]OII73322.1 hypothetical protein cubi_02534 [Cryptosporidium ubiquitum]